MGAPQVGDGGSFFKVPSMLYRPGDIIEEDLYFFYQGQHVLYRLKNLVWKEEDEARLKEAKLDELFIKFRDKQEHTKFVEEHLAKVLESPSVPEKKKAQLLYRTSVSMLEDLFQSPNSAENIKRSMKSVKNSIHFLTKDKSNFFELMSLASSDFSEYSHALHTAAYAICLANQMGIKSFNQISSIGTASMLHDIGKSKIDRSLLNKVEPLTPAEHEILKKHVQYSYELVHESRSIPEVSELIILQHHERPRGDGYPKALKEGEIHEFSKIVALADCFDQMTSDRPFAKAKRPIEVIELLKSDLKSDYDQNLLLDFIKMLKR